MDSSGSLFGGVSGCTCPCSRTSGLLPVSSELGKRSVRTVDSRKLARSRQGFDGLPYDLKLPFSEELRRKRPQTTRCLYSPLVESFEASSMRPVIPKNDNQSGSTSRTLLDSTTVTANKEGLLQRSDSDMYEFLRNPRVNNDGRTYSGPQDQISAAHGYHSVRTSHLDTCYGDVEARRNARLRPATLSLNQGLTRAGTRSVSSAIGVAGRPPATASRVRAGPVGLVVGLSVALLGLATAIQKRDLFGGTPQKICSRCDGYGVECCDVCDGHGRISWEGKMSHMDSCPRCFGSCLKKCPRCGGSRMKKGEPPFKQRSKLRPPTMI